MADPHNPGTAQADSDARAYQRGAMQISEQASTFHLFLGLAKWAALGIAVVVLFLTLWFHPGGSFFNGVIGAAVLGAVGYFALRAKPAAH